MTAEKATSLLNGRELVFNLMDIRPDFDADLFRAFVEMAVGFGATHINVGVLPFRYGWFLEKGGDPYPSWANWSMGLFRVFTPPELHEWIPQDSARALQEVFAAKMEILRKFGLKGSVDNGVEPCWLPEGIYRAHPNWRGAQCELGRIAQRPYFTPSIDDPGVLELYRWSLEHFCRAFPEVDSFSFLTNDSGAGISWTANTYPGINGPAEYRRRGPGARIGGWLRALHEGADRAGVRARFNLHSVGFTPAEREAVRPHLGPDLYHCSVNSEGESCGSAGASLGADYWTPTWPALGVTDAAAFVDGLQSVYHNPSGATLRASIGMDRWNLPRARRLIENFLADPGRGVTHRARVLSTTAAQLAGEAEADTLVKVWESVTMATHAILQVRQKGIGFTVTFCLPCARWLVRPLVPRPLELTEAEKAHYAGKMFSTGTDEQNADLCYVLGKPIFRGDSAVWVARWAYQEAIDRLRGAASTVAAVIGRAGEHADPSLALYRARLATLVCCVENAKLTILYQHALNIAHHARFGPNAYDYDDNIQFDQRCLELRKVARADLDNTAELIRVLESAPGPVIASAQTPEGENVFTFGPDLVAQLRRKMDIMLDHWQEYEQLYPTAKVYEFEPDAVSDEEPI